VSESFLDGKVTLHRGDCLEVLPLLEADSIDSCVTDPPYHLTSIVKRFASVKQLPLDDLPMFGGGI
jgi:DNA modification methylase